MCVCVCVRVRECVCVCESVCACENDSEAGVWVTLNKFNGDRDRREEATLVPCHQPKTELLQNIPKYLIVFFCC